MITVIIPALDESPSVVSVVEVARRDPRVTEVLVVDDGSIDGTPELAKDAGARVILSTLLGKGASMEDGMREARNEVLVYLDGDLLGLRGDLVERIAAPIFEGTADLVKANFSRDAGRVTTLTARPLLRTFFPELNHIEQPLGGMIAARRSRLRNVRFETDYGVDVGLLLDVAVTGARVAQVDIGHLQHDHRPIDVLGDMAVQVVRVILGRAARYGRLDLQQVREVEEIERRSRAELSVILQGLGQPERLALFDMDGTLLDGRFVVALADRTNKLADLHGLLDDASVASDERSRRIAALFQGVAKEVFEDVARSIPLMPGAADLVVTLRKKGYRVGIVSDSFRVATEIIRRRVFADFSIAHLVRFRHGLASGHVTLSPAMVHERGCKSHAFCKLNVLLHMCEQLSIGPEQVLAVGDNDPDACMLMAAGYSVAFQPKTSLVERSARRTVRESLLEITALLDHENHCP
jgi:glucosyl-3-phosphoglycerate synthase